jgi:hypothetical protein
MAHGITEQKLLLKGCLDGDPKKLREFEDASYLRTIRRAVREALATRLGKEEVDHATNVVIYAVYSRWEKLPGGELRERIRSFAVAIAEKFYLDWSDQRLRRKP